MLMTSNINVELQEDEALVCLLASGQTIALDELMRRHQGHVRNLAYRILGRWEQADDIAQECFIRVMRSAPHYRPAAKFTTWLFRIVVNLAQDYQRKQRRESIIQKLMLVRQENVVNPIIPDDYIQEHVRTALAELVEFQRMVVILHYYERLSCAQIAEITGKSPSAVESGLSRAYAALRHKLRKLDYFPR